MPKDTRIKDEIYAQLQNAAEAKKQATLEGLAKSRSYKRAGASEKQSAKAQVEWNKLSVEARRTTEEGQKGYDTWLSATFGVVMLCNQLNKALRASDPTGSLLSYIFTPVIERIHQKYNEKSYSATPSELPKLRYNVAFTADNKLDLFSLKDISRSDGKPLFARTQDPQVKAAQDILIAELETKYQEGLLIWLDQNGYQQVGTTRAFVDKHDGSPLTKAGTIPIC